MPNEQQIIYIPDLDDEDFLAMLNSPEGRQHLTDLLCVSIAPQLGTPIQLWPYQAEMLQRLREHEGIVVQPTTPTCSPRFEGEPEDW